MNQSSSSEKPKEDFLQTNKKYWEIILESLMISSKEFLILIPTIL